jgi:hypothetical protein
MKRKEIDQPRIVRVFPADLERVMASLPRTSDKTKDMMRAYFIDGESTGVIAERHGVAPSQILNSARSIRSHLAQDPQATGYAQVTLSLPLALGLALQTLANNIAERGSIALAKETLAPVERAVELANKRIKRT